MTDTSFDDQLAELRADFARALPSRVDRVTELWRLVKLGQGGGEGLAALQLAVHDLGGSGATFGYPDVSDVALALDDMLQPLVDLGASIPPLGQKLRIDRFIHQLRYAAARPL